MLNRKSFCFFFSVVENNNKNQQATGKKHATPSSKIQETINNREGKKTQTKRKKRYLKLDYIVPPRSETTAAGGAVSCALLSQ